MGTVCVAAFKPSVCVSGDLILLCRKLTGPCESSLKMCKVMLRVLATQAFQDLWSRDSMHVCVRALVYLLTHCICVRRCKRMCMWMCVRVCVIGNRRHCQLHFPTSCNRGQASLVRPRAEKQRKWHTHTHTQPRARSSGWRVESWPSHALHHNPV